MLERADQSLPTRMPQASPEAQHDKNMSWSGRITPPATACTDFSLMRRVHLALLTTLTDPDAAGLGGITATDPKE